MRIRISTAGFFLSLTAAAVAQMQPAGSGIYSCVDARGRTLTADRPIPDCADRAQRELSPSGSTRRVLEPTYTPREQAEREARARQARQEAERLAEERRRERALLVRYPNPAAHARERVEALAQIDAVMQAARKRQSELAGERRRIDEEMAFYQADPSRAPAPLRLRLDDNVKSMAVQQRFIGEQEEEKRRANARFDEESARLRKLWAGGGDAAASAAISPAAPSAAR